MWIAFYFQRTFSFSRYMRIILHVSLLSQIFHLYTAMKIRFGEWIFNRFKTPQVDIGNSVFFKIVSSYTNTLRPVPFLLPETVFEFFLCKRLQCLLNVFYASPLDVFNAFLTFGKNSIERELFNIWSCNLHELSLMVTCNQRTLFGVCGVLPQAKRENYSANLIVTLYTKNNFISITKLFSPNHHFVSL